MDMQNVAKLNIPEGDVRTIHDEDGNLIWGKVGYGVKYKGDTVQNGTPTPDAPVAVQTVTGEQTISINSTSCTVDLGSIELCKIGTYQDYIWKDGDTWKVHKATAKVTLDNTSFGGWQLTSSADGYIRGDTVNNVGFPSNLGYCDKLTIRTGSHGSYEYIWLQPTDTGRIYIQVLASRVSALTQAAFNDWVNSATPVLYYTLATPTDTTITNATLIAQLEAVEQWLTRYGYNATVSGNLPIIIDRTAL